MPFYSILALGESDLFLCTYAPKAIQMYLFADGREYQTV